MSTIFGKIIRRELPADIVYEDDVAVAFKDINPVAPFHVLVVPRKEIVSLAHITEEDREIVGHCLWVCRRVAEDAGHKEFRVVTNAGASTGQSVFHLHFHVLAGRSFQWPPG